MSFLYFICKVIFLTKIYILNKVVSISIRDMKLQGYAINEKNPLQRMEFRDGVFHIYYKPVVETVMLNFTVGE